MNTVLGKCSLCSGLVTVPSVWWGIVPPVPTCETCGATQDLPTIKMTKPRSYVGYRIPFTVAVPYQYGTALPASPWEGTAKPVTLDSTPRWITTTSDKTYMRPS